MIEVIPMERDNNNESLGVVAKAFFRSKLREEVEFEYFNVFCYLFHNF
jgi:hypothetical protein